MNNDAREQKAARILKAAIDADENMGPKVRQLIKKTSSGYEAAKQLGLLHDADVEAQTARQDLYNRIFPDDFDD